MLAASHEVTACDESRTRLEIYRGKKVEDPLQAISSKYQRSKRDEWNNSSAFLPTEADLYLGLKPAELWLFSLFDATRKSFLILGSWRGRNEAC